MEIFCPHAAGLDVHKRSVTAAVHTPQVRQVRTFRTMTTDLEQLAGWLAELGVTHVAMERTGVSWQPVYNVLEGDAFELWVVNAQHIKAVPGRKTDVKDAEWLCQLVRHGLVRASFIPDREQRALREVARYRKTLIRERANERNRIQKTLEGANLKLGSVVSDILGVHSRAMLAAIVAGEEDPQTLARLADGQLKASEAELMAALTGRLGDHQRFLLGEQLRHITALDEQIMRLSAEMDQRLVPFEEREQALVLLDTIPGIGRATAEAIVAEIGTDLGRFPSAGHLASWAGLCPGQHQSGGKRGSGRRRKGNPWLAEMLIEAAGAAAKKRGSVLQARYRRIAARRGRKRALVAVARTLVEIVYAVLTTRQPYREVGADYYDRRDRDRVARRLQQRLETLGFQVSLTSPPAAIAAQAAG